MHISCRSRPPLAGEGHLHHQCTAELDAPGDTSNHSQSTGRRPGGRGDRDHIVKEVGLPDSSLPLDAASFVACLATILELPVQALPEPAASEDPGTGWALARWLGGLGLGLARIADPESFSWAGPWIARVSSPQTCEPRSVVMYGVPSGVVWDPGGGGAIEKGWITDGFLVAAADIALALPASPAAPASTGSVAAVCVASAAGEPARSLGVVRALAGRGLEGDRHVSGTGTFPSGLPGSSLTLIEADVCESFDPPLRPDEHRRNVVTRGIDLKRTGRTRVYDRSGPLPRDAAL